MIVEGTYLGLYERDNWEFSERPNSTGVVGILPITPDGQLVFVEQYRIPVQANVIEIPAGLVGDEPEHAHEALEGTAARELLEETGYQADCITHLLSSPTSAGMTPEMTHIFAATELTRIHDGGGVEGEQITVHHIPCKDIKTWLVQMEDQGYLIDYKIHASLYLASQEGLIPG